MREMKRRFERNPPDEKRSGKKSSEKKKGGFWQNDVREALAKKGFETEAEGEEGVKVKVDFGDLSKSISSIMQLVQGTMKDSTRESDEEAEDSTNIMIFGSKKSKRPTDTTTTTPVKKRDKDGIAYADPEKVKRREEAKRQSNKKKKNKKESMPDVAARILAALAKGKEFEIKKPEAKADSGEQEANADSSDKEFTTFEIKLGDKKEEKNDEEL